MAVQGTGPLLERDAGPEERTTRRGGRLCLPAFQRGGEDAGGSIGSDQCLRFRSRSSLRHPSFPSSEKEGAAEVRVVPGSRRARECGRLSAREREAPGAVPTLCRVFCSSPSADR